MLLTVLMWACYVYVAVWALAAIVFYLVNRALVEYGERPSVLGAVALGFVWPGVLFMLACLAWVVFTTQRGDADPDNMLELDSDSER